MRFRGRDDLQTAKTIGTRNNCLTRIEKIKYTHITCYQETIAINYIVLFDMFSNSPILEFHGKKSRKLCLLVRSFVLLWNKNLIKIKTSVCMHLDHDPVV